MASRCRHSFALALSLSFLTEFYRRFWIWVFSEERRRVKEEAAWRDFSFDLVVFEAPPKLWILTTACSTVCFMLLCFFRQRFNLVIRPFSMNLRPKRICYGLQYFGAFHIKKIFYCQLLGLFSVGVEMQNAVTIHWVDSIVDGPRGPPPRWKCSYANGGRAHILIYMLSMHASISVSLLRKKERNHQGPACSKLLHNFSYFSEKHK
ncbi:uncharacterized protein LOC126614720 [Malus sylvestris]|uniref:uncharacterized protein LOC126614720 n=1 Tax=Malus sylvestris TaxID=3752 RepID=UPI0021AD3E94|nr:uncharacterized protein LOC126614720 [Malus sylvestris]